MIDVPASSHAADGVRGSKHGEEGGKDKQQGCVIVREAREQDRDEQADNDEDVSAGAGTAS